jgi:hypothetical protein
MACVHTLRYWRGQALVSEGLVGRLAAERVQVSTAVLRGAAADNGSLFSGLQDELFFGTNSLGADFDDRSDSYSSASSQDALSP